MIKLFSSRNRKTRKAAAILVLAFCVPVIWAQSVKEMQKQKQSADSDVKQTSAELNANEKLVSQSLSELRQIDEDIEASQQEIESVEGQLFVLNDTIQVLENDIVSSEEDLNNLRGQYLAAVKKMRVARKRNSDLVFIFAAKNFNDARRRMRYMREFSAWKDRRSEEIAKTMTNLHEQRQGLVQAHEDVAVALQREKSAQTRLTRQKEEQQTTVVKLKANSETLKSKLAKRQEESRRLSNQISQIIAAQQAQIARDAAQRAAEEQRLAAERAAAERAAAEKAEAERKEAEQRQLAAEKAKAEAEKAKAEAAKKAAQAPVAATTKKQETPKKVEQPKKAEQPKKQEQPKKAETPKTAPAQAVTTPANDNSATPGKGEYADARRRQPRSSSPSTKATQPATTPAPAPAQPTATGFAGMKGSLPHPVNGSFKIISSFGVHPISPELPDIMDENLGIDARVANGAAACAVYDGEVLSVLDKSNAPGFRNIIVVKHGEYITVYANLETLTVRSGQKVKQGQKLGTVGSDFDDPSHGLIHFEVWKNQTHLDPAAWIRK